MKGKQQRPLGRPRVSEQTKPTTELIIEAATRLFIENGYQNVSVDDVAKKSNVTKATVYYYYASKAELFTETMVQMMIRIRGRINSLLNEPIPLKQRLLKITQTHLKATVDIDMDGFMKGVKNTLSEEQEMKISNAESEMYQSIEQAFENAIREGEIRAIDAKFAAHAYLSLLKVGYYNSEKEQLFSSIEKVAAEIIELLWQGIQTKEGK